MESMAIVYLCVVSSKPMEQWWPLTIQTTWVVWFDQSLAMLKENHFSLSFFSNWKHRDWISVWLQAMQRTIKLQPNWVFQRCFDGFLFCTWFPVRITGAARVKEKRSRKSNCLFDNRNAFDYRIIYLCHNRGLLLLLLFFPQLCAVPAIGLCFCFLRFENENHTPNTKSYLAQSNRYTIVSREILWFMVASLSWLQCCIKNCQ